MASQSFFFQIYNAKTKDKIGPFKEDDWKPLNMHTCVIVNEYFVKVFNQKDTSTLPVAKQMAMEKEDEILCDLKITREAVIKEIDKGRLASCSSLIFLCIPVNGGF